MARRVQLQEGSLLEYLQVGILGNLRKPFWLFMYLNIQAGPILLLDNENKTKNSKGSSQYRHKKI